MADLAQGISVERGADLQDALRAIVGFQQFHSAENSPEMQSRGRLIRKTLPQELSEIQTALAQHLGQYGGDLFVQGSDGVTRKALVPWVRIASRRMSPSATNGWYLVYLFHPDASGVSLCLSHGSTVPQEGNFKARDKSEIERLMEWAATVVGAEFATNTAVRRGVALGRQRLAAAYERTTVFSKFYPAGAIPDEDQLLADLVDFSRVLAKLYVAQDAGLTPGSANPDVLQVLQAAQEVASPFQHNGHGQGWGLDHPARVAVELRAMEVAEEWLTNQRFSYTDVSSTDSCDFRAERDGESWVIEVKGTTGGPASILVTRNEVALHQAHHPKNALLVVHGIKLGADRLSASGGALLAICPWRLEDSRLHPTAFEYRLD